MKSRLFLGLSVALAAAAAVVVTVRLAKPPPGLAGPVEFAGTEGGGPAWHMVDFQYSPGGRLQVVWGMQDDSTLAVFDLDPREWRLRAWRDGRLRCESRAGIDAYREGRRRVGLYRRGGSAVLCLDDRLLDAWPDFPVPPGRWGAVRLDGDRACAVLECRARPVGPVRFRDDFMRDRPEQNWEVVRGSWELYGQSFPERSANPFRLYARFSDDPPGGGRRFRDMSGIGLILGREGESMTEALAVRVAPDSPASRAGIRDGDKVTAVDDTPPSGPWYDPGNIWGDIGEKVTVTFNGRTAGMVREMRYWESLEESTPLPGSAEDGEAMAVTGMSMWRDYTLSASVQPWGRGDVGLVFAYLDPENYAALEWEGGPGGAMRIAEVAGGERRVLAENKGGFVSGQFYSLGVQWEGSSVTALLGGVPALSAEGLSAARGRVGIHARLSSGAFFDDVLVLGAGMSEPVQPAAERFADPAVDDPYMKLWANPVYDWEQLLKGGCRYRHTLYGSACVTFTQGPVSGASIAVRDEKGGRLSETRFVISQDGSSVRVSSPDHPGEDFPLSKTAPAGFSVLPGSIVVTQGGSSRELSRGAGTDAPLLVCAEGLSAPGLGGLVVHSPTFRKYSFDRAPADWTIAGGSWGIYNRWTCTLQWSWFGGFSEDDAGAIWNRLPLEGDQWMEAVVSPLMRGEGSYYRGEGYQGFSLFLCGDGADPESGYLVGFRSGRVYVSRRGVKLKQSLLPEMNLYHRWLVIQVSRTGGKIEVRIGGKTVLECEDPDPIGGGQAGFGVVGTGILIARVRLSGQKTGGRCDPLE